MGRRRRKNRTHLKGPATGETEEKVPKSFVIKSGDVTTSITQLVKDMRQLMEPNTATRLRERPHARLRDYLTIAPTLGVTHLLAFSLTDAANVHMRVARLPQGPTLTFRVQRYSLVKDLVGSALRNVGMAPAGEFRNPPLLVLNGFQQQPDGPALPQLRLMSTMFQGIFPPISVEKSALPTFRRVLLLSYNHSTNLISMRHFTISVKPHGVSRRVRKVLGATTNSKARKTPNLSSADDIADYLLRRTGTPGSEASTAGYDSMSETDASEAESDTNAVELPEDYVGRGNRKGERKAVRLVETGPRLELRLIKVVEGLVGSKRGEGETVFHDIVRKSKAETAEQKKEHEERRKIRDARRAEQAANVARKKAEKESKKKVRIQDGTEADADAEADAEEEDNEEGDDDDLDVEGLSDADPEEALERIRNRPAKRAQDEDDEFAYEDAAGAEDDDSMDDDDDVEDWDEDQGMSDVSSNHEESSADEEEVARPVKKRPVGGKARF